MKRNLLLLVLPVFSGVLLGLLFYKLMPAFLVFGVLVPMVLFLHLVKNRKILGLGGFLTGFIYFLFFLYTSTLIQWYGFESEPVFLKGAYVVASIAGGLFWAAFVVLSHYGWRRSWSSMLLLPSLFVLMEFSRRFVAFGFTWGFLGYLTEDLALVRQGASLFGVLGLSFLIVFVNTGIALLLISAVRRDLRSGIRSLALALLVLGGVSAGTVWSQARVTEIGEIRVAVMQTGQLRPAERLGDEPISSLFEEARLSNPDLIVMPESLLDAKNTLPPSFEELEESMNELAEGFSGMVAFGAFRVEGSRIFNSFFLWADGSVQALYDKHYLVPFGEYRPVFWSAFAPKNATTYERGPSHQVLEAAGLRMGAVICQEVIYPEAGMRSVREGAQLFVSGANDGLAGHSDALSSFAPSESNWFHRVEHTMARFRAIESGRYLIRSTKIGIASIMNPEGEELVRFESGEKRSEIRSVKLLEGSTLFASAGDAPLVALSLFAGGLIIMKKRYAL